jgi:hypothetical protein
VDPRASVIQTGFDDEPTAVEQKHLTPGKDSEKEGTPEVARDRSTAEPGA